MGSTIDQNLTDPIKQLCKNKYFLPITGLSYEGSYSKQGSTVPIDQISLYPRYFGFGIQPTTLLLKSLEWSKVATFLIALVSHAVGFERTLVKVTLRSYEHPDKL